MKPDRVRGRRPVASLAEPGTALAALGDAVVACRACPRLVAHRERVAAEKVRRHAAETYWGRPIRAFGDPRATLVIVGLAPAAHGANRTGRPFTGDGTGGAGEWVARGLYEIGKASRSTWRQADDGLVLAGVLVTNAVRCVPPGNRPTAEEVRRCAPFLAAELAALPALRVVLALGRVAFTALLDAWPAAGGGPVPSPKPTFAHGRELPLAPGRALAGATLLAAYHPSRQNTNTGRLTWHMWLRVLRRAAELAGGGTIGRDA